MNAPRPWLPGAMLVSAVTAVAIAGGVAAVAVQETPIDPEEVARAAAAPKPFTAPDYAPTVDTTGCEIPQFDDEGAGWQQSVAEGSVRAQIEAFLRQDQRGREADPLGRGLIGVAADAATRSFVVVVDPTVANVEDVRRGVTGAVRTQPPVRVQTGCYSAGAISATLAEVRALAARSRASYGVRVDPATARVVVTVRRDAPLVEPLTERLGDRVRVVEFD